MTRLKIMASHWSIPFMAAILLAGTVILFVTAPIWAWFLVPLGVVAQYNNEYALHRFIFHLPPPQNQWRFDLLYQAHYGHHDFPTNRGLFFVPPWVSLPILAAQFLGVWYVASLFSVHGLAISASVVLVGGVGTFLMYEWFHMSAHLTVPKTRLERHVTRLHNQHHFRDFTRWFHVSPGGKIIDRAMGTAIDEAALRHQQRAEFIRTLNMRPDDPRLVAARARFADKYELSAAEIAQAART